MKYLFTLSVALLSFTFLGLSQNQNLYSDALAHTGMVGSADLEGFTTHRIFAQLDAPDDQCLSVTGFDEMPLTISTSTSFYQFELGASSGNGVNSTLLSFIPEVRYDSYVTIGYASSATLGIPYVENPEGEILLEGDGNFGFVQDPNANWEPGFENGENISLQTFVGGGWFAVPGSANALGVGINNSVLLGQFTTDGDFDYCLNYQVIDGQGVSTIYSGACAFIESGCMDQTACNYNPDATIDDQSCADVGDFCLHPLTLEGIYNDNCECESMLFGCMDETACNYNEEANIAGQCFFPAGPCEEEGIINGIYSDSCGCEGDVLGCTDVDSGNYNEEAVVDDGSCTGVDSCADAQNLTLDGGLIESSNINSTDENGPNVSSCVSPSLNGGDVWFTFIGDGSTVTVQTYDFDTVIALYDSCDGEAIDCDDDGGEGTGSLIGGMCTVVGQQYFVQVGGWNEGQGVFSIELSTATDLDPLLTGCSDPASCNYSATWACSDEYCVYPGASCNDNNSGTMNDTYGDDCECAGDSAGCMDEAACNYNPDATEDDGSCAVAGDFCIHPLTLEGLYNNDCECVSQLFGCMDETACNYNPEANIEGECLFGGDECEEEGIVNGIFNDSCGCEGDTLGCTDVDSGNYNPEATIDDGSCSGAETCQEGQELTINGDAVVGSNIGSTNSNESEESGCSQSMNGGDVWYTFTGDGSIVDIETYDFDTVIALYTSCDGTAVDCNDDGGVGVASLISGVCTVLDQEYYVEVEGWNESQGLFSIAVYTSDIDPETAGCSDPLSCNYDVDWDCSDEFCVYPGASCDDFDWNTINDTYGDDCECVGEYGGCTDVNACNYDDNASIDDGSCILVGSSCDDFDTETINDIISDTCDCAGEYGGCTDPAANNYDDNASTDDGTCCFGEFISVVLYDGFGDGGSAYTLSDNSFVEIASGALTTGVISNLPDVCVADGCYLFELTPDFWEFEISADLFVNGELVFQHAEGDSFEQYPIVINVGNDPECIILGCIDDTACNYSGLATEDNGSCDYESCVGCSTPGATNYSEIVTQDDGSCSWDISGVVFIDDNFNGVLDPFEQTLPYQNVIITTLGEQIITDNNGTFSTTGLAAGAYELYVEYTGSWTNYTTPIEYTLDFPLNGGTPIYFGVTNETVPSPSACVDFYQWGAGVPCNDQLGYNICYRNMSPYPISGVIEVVLDDLLEFSFSNPAAENIDGQTISWSFENLASWEMFFDDIIVNTPSEQNIGEFMSSHVTIYVDYEGELIPVTEQTIVQEVTCAYDPNDITGIPEGYTDEHLVLADTRMEYLIRFQNTGNASATNVLVVDSLDAGMDFSSFQLVANSHNVMTTIDENGRVEFLFEDINLPDSIADEPGSHGMISFKIDFIDDIVTGEEVNSTAHIFFDNNPAVVTNTTWHTIHECGGEAAFDLSSEAICKGEEVNMTSTNPLVESYQWNIQSSSASTLSEYNVEFPEEGDYIIQLVAENPLCTESSMQMLTVYDLPEAILTEDGAYLTANEGAEYQWYLNDEPIYGAIGQTHAVLEDGIYTVEVFNENGCSDISEAVMVVSIEELEGAEFEIYPNPMSDVAFIEFTSNSRKTIKLLDASGKEVRVWQNITDQRVEISRGSLARGTYFVFCA